jgi:predicted nucleotidyltransferase
MAEINASILNSVKTFIDQLKERGIPVEAAYLFGSYAKGREKEWSDIDVAIISSTISDDRLEERIRFTKISSTIDSRIEPVPFRPDTFVDEDPLVWEIKKEGILISSEG